MSTPRDKSAALLAEIAKTGVSSEDMSAFELALVGASNGFNRWVVSCAQAAGQPGMSIIDALVLWSVARTQRAKRATEISFTLSIEDIHLVTYALKKLERMEFVSRQKSGKETLYSATPSGKAFVARYREIREQYLIETFNLLKEADTDLVVLTRKLRAISGIYEQAARITTGL